MYTEYPGREPSIGFDPPPATVVIRPSIATFLTRELPVSATYKLPAGSMATPAGDFNKAVVAAPPSPPKPAIPEPATRGDGPIGGNLTDSVVVRVCDVQVPGVVDSHSLRLIQQGRLCRSSIAAEPWLSGASNSADCTVGRNSHNTVRTSIRNVEIRIAVKRQARGTVQQGSSGGAAIGFEICLPNASKSCDDAGGAD